MTLTAELGRPPVLVRLCGFISTRNEMEFVNGVAGLVVGAALLSGETLAWSPALAGLTEMLPEQVWGGMLLACGLASFFAWRCQLHRCRLATMFVWMAGWGFLAWQAILTTNGQTMIGGLCAALTLGSMLAYRSIRQRGRSYVR